MRRRTSACWRRATGGGSGRGVLAVREGRGWGCAGAGDISGKSLVQLLQRGVPPLAACELAGMKFAGTMIEMNPQSHFQQISLLAAIALARRSRWALAYVFHPKDLPRLRRRYAHARIHCRWYATALGPHMLSDDRLWAMCRADWGCKNKVGVRGVEHADAASARQRR
jgi:hypothetical protein